MRKAKRNIMSFLLALLMVLTICPYTVKAEGTTHTATNADELTEKINNAQDGDTIIVKNQITLSTGVEITKNITLDFETDSSIDCSDSNSPAAITISGCHVTIIGNGKIGGDPSGGTNNAIMVKEGIEDTSLNIEYINCVEALATDDNPATPATVTVNIAKGFFSGNPMFNVNGGTIVINGGMFSESPEAYLGENTVLIDNGENAGYEVRSSIMSEKFKQILTDGKLVIPSVTPANEMEAMKFAFAALYPYQSEETDFFPTPIADNIYDIYYYNYTDNTDEVHRVEAVYTGSANNEAVTKARAFAANLPVDPADPYVSTFRIVDLEVINMWASGFDPNAISSKYLTGMANYSGELKKYLGNANLDFKVVYVGAGDDTDLFTVSIGDSVISVNDVICASPEMNVKAQAEHVIYVPDGTATTKEALMSAAQKRINEYLGDSSKVILSYGGSFNTLGSDESYRQSMLNKLGLSAPEHYFIATVNGHQFKLLIVPDSSKMVTPTYKTVDIISNVAITSASSEIPLDTNIRASKLTEGTTYDSIIDKLDVKDNVTFDLKIFSFSKEQYISSISRDKFKVSIPLTAELKGKNLAAYYVGEDGKITKYDVEIVDGCAVFNTDHFSIYTIAEDPTQVTTEATTGADRKTTKSSKTGDNTSLILLFSLLLLSTMGLMIGKRKVNR